MSEHECIKSMLAAADMTHIEQQAKAINHVVHLNFPVSEDHMNDWRGFSTDANTRVKTL